LTLTVRMAKSCHDQIAKSFAAHVDSVWCRTVSLTPATRDGSPAEIRDRPKASLAAITEALPNNGTSAFSFFSWFKKNEPAEAFIGKIDRVHLLGV
jgi:hypothetical protein